MNGAKLIMGKQLGFRVENSISVEIPDGRMDKFVSTMIMTFRHFDQNGICHKNCVARMLSFALKLHCCMVKSAMPCVKRLQANKSEGGMLL